ncbi:unnamed protein product [Ostreobium quekettii]|uniref:Uncharacterized protein n=1 Tax=Ostreobium quekettii TaxID=121088 RepID=A0A8S1J5K7_9CHLO|nr:unnamed protein product [Ostreobium quekettii]|eukprot:evm.model.scf_1616.2 EVM.evm.TU.scf_1616.2   scf_1616:5799-8558(+)
MKRAVPRAALAALQGPRWSRSDAQSGPDTPRRHRFLTDPHANCCNGQCTPSGIRHSALTARSCGRVVARARPRVDGDVGVAGSSERADALKREVQLLRQEVAEVRAAKEADTAACLAQCGELEEALALAQHELERSSGLRSEEGGVEVSQLMEAVGRQEAMLTGLRERLREAEVGQIDVQGRAGERALEAGVERRRAAELEGRCGEVAARVGEARREAEEAAMGLGEQLEDARALAFSAEEYAQITNRHLGQREEEIRGLEGELEGLRLECERVSEECVRVEARRRALGAQAAASERSAAAGGKGSVADVKRQYHVVVGEVEDLGATVKALQAQLEEKKRESKELRAMLVEIQAALRQRNQRENRLRQEVAGMQANVAKSAEVIRGLNKDKRKGRSEQTKSNALIRRLENELKQLRGQFAAKSEEVHGLIDELKTTKLAENDTTANLGNAQAEIEALLLKEIQQKSEISNLAARIISLQSSLIKKKQDLHAQTAALKQREDELACVTTQMKEAQDISSGRASDLERSLSELQTFNDRQLGVLDELSVERDLLLKARESWGAQVSEVSDELRAAQDTIAAKDRIASEADSRVQDMKAKLTELRVQLQQARLDLEQLNTTEGKAVATVVALQQELEKKQRSLESAAGGNQVLESRLTGLGEELMQQAQHLLEAEQTVAELQERVMARQDKEEEDVASVMQLKEEAEAEVDAAAQLLTMAEKIADELEEVNINPETESTGSEELQQEVLELERSLVKQADILSNALDRADLLQEQAIALETELGEQQEASTGGTVVGSSPNGDRSAATCTGMPTAAGRQAQFDESLDELLLEMTEQYEDLIASLEAAVTDDQRIAKLLDHTRGLEEENVGLRRALLSRRQAMAKAHSFIKERLQHQGPELPNTDPQGAKLIVGSESVDDLES